MSILVAIFTFFLWSSVFSFSKIALQSSSVIFFISIRFLLAGIILLIYSLIKYKKKCLTDIKNNILVIIIFGVLAFYFTNIFENWGLQYLSSSKSCFIYSLTPFFSALLSYIHLKEEMTLKKWIGLFIGFIGILPVLSIQNDSLSKSFFLISLPDLSLLLATFLSSYGWVILKKLTHKKKNINITTINGASMLIAGLIASIHAFLTHSYLIKGANPYTFIQMLIVLTLISNIICCNLYGILLKKHSATFLSFIGILCIFFSAIHGYIFLGEKPSTTIFLSSFIIALGIWLFYKSEQQQASLLKNY